LVPKLAIVQDLIFEWLIFSHRRQIQTTIFA